MFNTQQIDSPFKTKDIYTHSGNKGNKMYKLAKFDYKEYTNLIDLFSRSRKGEAIDNFYHELKKLKPGGFISDDLKIKLDRWCETSPSQYNTWRKAGSCARQIRDMILDCINGEDVYAPNEMVLPHLQISVEEIFHMPCEYYSDWNAMYGITSNRKSAMVRENDPNSSCNPNSETFLTFFSLANLDSWQQPKCLAKPIRAKYEKNMLSSSFFKLMRENMNSLFQTPKTSNYSAKKLIPTLTDKMMRYSVFFFESDIMNSAINSFRNKPFKKLSFLNISRKQGWSVFDAFIFLPDGKRCIFIESKLDRDISHTVKLDGKIIKLSQITRAMESAYLFTHHPDSNFHGWEYDYLFICPRQEYESELKEYSKIIPRIQNPNLTELNEEYLSLKIDSDPVKKPLFEDFLSTHHKHIHVLFWDQLFEILEETDPGFLIKYMENLRLKDKSMYDRWRSRLNLASIPCKQT